MAKSPKDVQSLVSPELPRNSPGGSHRIPEPSETPDMQAGLLPGETTLKLRMREVRYTKDPRRMQALWDTTAHGHRSQRVQGHCWADRFHSVRTPSSPRSMLWDQDDPGKSATEFSVLRGESRWHLISLDLQGLVIIKSQVGPICCPYSSCAPSPSCPSRR